MQRVIVSTSLPFSADRMNAVTTNGIPPFFVLNANHPRHDQTRAEDRRAAGHESAPRQVIYPGRRFHIYATFPECNISIHQLNGFKNQNTVFATGTSIFDRSCQSNVGELMLKYGGGGHDAAGTCQIDNDRATEVLAELVGAINANEQMKRAS